VRRNTIRVPHDVARYLRLGHPWVYREAIGGRPLRDAPGEVVEIVDGDGELVGRGLFEGDQARSRSGCGPTTIARSTPTWSPTGSSARSRCAGGSATSPSSSACA
jgi:23S rRNA G2069 N7-methylase RlmK/C1962 C5-methylase RlmI